MVLERFQEMQVQVVSLEIIAENGFLVLVWIWYVLFAIIALLLAVGPSQEE